MQGKSTDFARHAIPSIRKQRILVTFTKSQPRKSLPGDAQRPATSAASSHWGPPPSRSTNHNRHHLGPKHYGTVPTTGVLPAPPIRATIPAPNGMQPLFVTAPVVPPMSFPAPVPIPPGSTGWTAAPPRHPPPRIPVPGTGVFLPPPGSGNNNSSQQLPAATLTEVNQSVETPTTLEKENGKTSHNHNSSASASPKGKMQRQECNGHVEVDQAVEAQQDSDDKAAASH